jgi:polyhydroxybutyrate depolymerase
MGGQQRTYLLHAPTTYNSNHPLPLVLAFHGYGSQGRDLANGAGFSQLADQQGFLVVYPDGRDRRWNLNRTSLTNVDDRAFVSALIDRLVESGAVDSQHIYAMGVSNGGFFVQGLACEEQTRIRAFATVVASLPGALQTTCQTTRPVPMLMINGTSDRKVTTSAAAIWVAAALGIAAACGLWQQALLGAGVALLVLAVFIYLEKR